MGRVNKPSTDSDPQQKEKLPSPAALQARYGIQKEEIASFQSCIRVFYRGETIIREGDEDKSLYLLRSGSVGVYKRREDGELEFINSIEATNFVGEMSLINDEPRSATVKALADEVLVYAINRPNLGVIFSNPTWSELLISRMTRDLAVNNNQIMGYTKQISQLREENRQLRAEAEQNVKDQAVWLRKLGEFTETLHLLVLAIRDLNVYGSRSWAYMQVFQRALQALYGHYYQELRPGEQEANYRELLTVLKKIRADTAPGVADELADYVAKHTKTRS